MDTNPAAVDGVEIDGGVHGVITQEQPEKSWLPAGSDADFGGDMNSRSLLASLSG